MIHRGRADTPSCGDEIEVQLREDAGVLLDVSYRTRSCLFTRRSAELLGAVVTGLSPAAARDMADLVRRELRDGPLPVELAELADVRMYPARIRCALLPWDALRAAVDHAGAGQAEGPGLPSHATGI